MRSFHAICVALIVVASRGQFLVHGSKWISNSPQTSYAAAPALHAVKSSYVHAGPAVATAAAVPLISRAVAVHHAAPAIATAPVFAAHAVPLRAAPAVAVAAAPTVAVAAAPAVAVAAAPAVTVAAAPAVTVAAAPGNVGVVAHAPPRKVQTHEVHTGSGRQAIRIEDFQAGDQVIRVHEAPQAPPQVAQVAVPGEQHHIRVINHQSGPAHIERVVHRQQTQVIDLQKPGRPGARIVQVVRVQSPPPSVEFVDAGGSNHHVYHAKDTAAAAPAIVAHAAPFVSRAVATHHAIPAVAVHHAAPAVAVHHAAPAVAVHHAAPAVAVHHAAPSIAAYRTIATRVVNTPSVNGKAFYGSHYGNTAVVH
ncbi:hypothetical protein BIW11_00873 [Tropilaelaps mercedesae]|uniref:Uncharacterized protein n=1 Tax=Tropilaelaps mercedesae TaxID=418985 RepID=A0A1V9XNE2_9ACAR|nr:hypothetical protein BIW11_00873 [Tropilaelaps mercedesae]